MLKLTSSNVSRILSECLFPEDDSYPGAIVVKGVMRVFCFDPVKIEDKRENIKELLSQLPQEFFESTGGGYTFLAACYTSANELWGEHPNVEELMCLGVATELVRYCLPKSLWSVLPGGMPYFVVCI